MKTTEANYETLRKVLGLSPQPTKEDPKILSSKLGIPLQEKHVNWVLSTAQAYLGRQEMIRDTDPLTIKINKDLKKARKRIETFSKFVKSLSTAAQQRIIRPHVEEKICTTPKVSRTSKDVLFGQLAYIYKDATGEEVNITGTGAIGEFVKKFLSRIGEPPPSAGSTFQNSLRQTFKRLRKQDSLYSILPY